MRTGSAACLALALFFGGAATLASPPARAQTGQAPQTERDAARGYDHLGDEHAAKGQWREALASYRQALLLRRRLAAADPGDVGLAVELMTTLIAIGGAAQELADAPGARAAYEESLVIARRLVAASPDSVDRQRDLGASLFGLGDALASGGDGAKGRPLMAEGLAIRRRLAAAGPTDARLQHDLAASLRVLAWTKGSGVSWGDLTAQLMIMRHAGLLSPDDERWLFEAIAYSSPDSQR
jgi:tetratricopeptide (TPR) repeat protein